jgi:hypothetical protein
LHEEFAMPGFAWRQEPTTRPFSGQSEPRIELEAVGNGTVVVSAAGELTTFSSPVLRATLLAAVGSSADCVVVDPHANHELRNTTIQRHIHRDDERQGDVYDRD